MPTVREMTEWTDFDQVQYRLALTLGLMGESSGDPMGNLKWIWWSDNPLGNLLGRLLADLVECCALEESPEGQYRWNPDYSPARANDMARALLEKRRVDA